MTVARKAHTCDICQYPIAPGTDYSALHVTPWDSWNEDGVFYVARCHWCCAQLGHAYMIYEREDCYAADVLQDWVQDITCMSIPDLIGAIARLAAGLATVRQEVLR